MTPAPHPHRRPEVHPADLTPGAIEAWIHEIRPVLHALRTSPAPSSSAGRRQWLADQERVAAQVIDLLDCDTAAAETDGTPCEELAWLHTQVCAVIEGLDQVRGPGAVAA